MSRRPPAWSIRTRIAASFALASMVITTAVLVFVNLASQRSFAAFAVGGVQGAEPYSAPSVASVAPDPDAPAHSGATVAVVREVSTLQWQWSTVGIVAAGFLAGGLGWYLSRRTLRPIDRITATANRISASNLDERIALDGPDDELRRLSRAVDDLLDRLETAFESQRRFVAQASHELRTPLAVQRAAVQIGLDDAAGPDEIRSTRDELLEQNRRTEHLVESLLVLAEADRGLVGEGEEIDLATLADEALAGAAGAGHAAGVQLVHEQRAAPPGLPPLRGEPTLVQQLLANLVGNAVEYNVSGGSVWIRTRGDGFAVENTGPVVPAEVVPLLVEPFRRCPSTATAPGVRHSGLGLSIVASIVHAHGWQLTVTARAAGGLLVDVSSM